MVAIWAEQETGVPTLHELSERVEAARLAWHEAWKLDGWESSTERRTYHEYQDAIAELGQALTNRESKRLGEWLQ